MPYLRSGQGGAESNRHDRGCSHPDHARAHPSRPRMESNHPPTVYRVASHPCGAAREPWSRAIRLCRWNTKAPTLFAAGAMVCGYRTPPSDLRLHIGHKKVKPPA